ncbi:MAG: PAS domain-containing protein [Balneolales bacterium]|nr:PAS domain-containing protein [Balneolales bacterium]
MVLADLINNAFKEITDLLSSCFGDTEAARSPYFFCFNEKDDLLFSSPSLLNRCHAGSANKHKIKDIPFDPENNWDSRKVFENIQKGEVLREAGLFRFDIEPSPAVFNFSIIPNSAKVTGADSEKIILCSVVKSPDKLKTVKKSSRPLLCLINRECGLQWTNPAFCKITGYSVEQKTENILLGYLGEYAQSQLLWILAEFESNPDPDSARMFYGKVKTEDNNFIVVEWSVKRFMSKESALPGLFLVEGFLTETNKGDENVFEERAISDLYKLIDFYDEMLKTIDTEIVAFDSSHRYMFVNKKAIQNDEIRKWIIGRTDFDYCEYRNKPVEIAVRRRELFDKAVEGQKSITFEDEVQTGNGEKRVMMRTLTPYFNDKGGLRFILAYGTDITQKKQVMEQLRYAKDKALEANKVKSEFLANISHEIRTPMNAVIGFADLLALELQDSRHLSFLEAIKSSGKNLLHIINDLLDLSKIEAGKLVIEPNKTDIRKVTAEITQLFRLEANKKGIKLSMHVASDVPDIFYVDDVRLKQILINLLGNAIKFTKVGSVNIEVRPNNRNFFGLSRILFIVKDTGIGIRKEYLTKVFQSFEQESGSITREFGGTGLGLAISAKLAKQMGGQIIVSSEAGIGSVFTLSLPDSLVQKEEGYLSTFKKEHQLETEFSLIESDKILRSEFYSDFKKNVDQLPPALREKLISEALPAVENLKTGLYLPDMQLLIKNLKDIGLEAGNEFFIVFGNELNRAFKEMELEKILSLLMEFSDILDELSH